MQVRACRQGPSPEVYEYESIAFHRGHKGASGSKIGRIQVVEDFQLSSLNLVLSSSVSRHMANSGWKS
ncbi:hypothetical protein LEMLEM_LOCUS16473 [Lemmus lemmus]